MTIRTNFGSATVVLLFALASACGGTIGSTVDGGGADGGSSEDGGSDGGSCTIDPLPGDRACVPGTARSNTPIDISVAGPGCRSCFSTDEPCEVVVTGTVVKVSMMSKTCIDRSPGSGSPACPPVCLLPETTCKLPALAAGTYTVEVSGEPTSSRAPRTLVVADDATTTSCKLPPAGRPPEPLDGAKYPTTCATANDCLSATVGVICGPCKCPDAAIAKTSLDTYSADYRARLSECDADKSGGLDCAACPPRKVDCEIAPDALTGTCKLVPDP